MGIFLHKLLLGIILSILIYSPASFSAKNETLLNCLIKLHSNQKLSQNNLLKETEQAFIDSEDIVYFSKGERLQLKAGDFKPGNTYTIVIYNNKLIIGHHVVGIPSYVVGGPGSHLSLFMALERTSKSGYIPYTELMKDFSGAIKIQADGTIDISGFHMKGPSEPAANNILELVKKISPNSTTRVTPDRLSTLPAYPE